METTDHPVFLKMHNVIQNYAWGSTTSLQELFALNNSENQPQAEIWMGAHANGCSKVNINGTTMPLSDFINSDARAVLGDKTQAEFGELPYLFKVLAAEKALSIQVHPNKKQAEQGFNKEELQNIPLQDAARNYKDANHKPELVFALTPYQAMNGFRDIEEIIAAFEQLDIDELSPLLNRFTRQKNSLGLQEFFSAMLSLQGKAKESAVNSLLRAAGSNTQDEIYALILCLAEQYPGDLGLFSPLLLNVITLQPGQAMFLDACTPHAYINGTGLEIMANSDNVLRAGLTGKHIDIKELAANTLFESKAYNSILSVPEISTGAEHYQIPVSDFNFSVYRQGLTLQTQSAEIIFAVDAPLTLRHENQERLTINKGESVFIPAYSRAYQVLSQGCFARAYN
ncbi:mannose-6-phosphate isomerase, class I [Psychromonas aquimarina]|uniref:mannose-6-phosphate isomerase, class I n=1 Tax=Psychromonas aquimarina TaxID=444919 RepID=UPI000412BC10|nr:mannose-6-phosphate isomerase, class I [Psychromonas aquimarina]